MRIYQGNDNLSSLQVSMDLGALEIFIEKTTPAATLGEFFGSDTMQMTYNSQGRQENFCPSIPLAMLAYYSSMNMGYTECYYDATQTTKIKSIKFRVEVGFGGSMPLSDNKNILLTTNIAGFSKLEVYAISTGKNVDASGNAIPVALTTYNYINLESGNQKVLDVSQALTVVMTPAPKEVTFTDKTGNSYVQSIEPLKSAARAVNEIAAVYGTTVNDSFGIAGSTVSASVFQASKVEPGGHRYIGLGVSPYVKILVNTQTSDKDGLMIVIPKIVE